MDDRLQALTNSKEVVIIVYRLLRVIGQTQSMNESYARIFPIVTSRSPSNRPGSDGGPFQPSTKDLAVEGGSGSQGLVFDPQAELSHMDEILHSKNQDTVNRCLPSTSMLQLSHES